MIYTCEFIGCDKIYKTRGGYLNHVSKMHSNDKKKIDEDWSKDELNLAMELSMKEQYKDFIPDEQLVDDMAALSIEKKKCVICMDKNPNVAFISCGHVVACDKCADNLMKNQYAYNKCPVCRQKITRILRIYF